MMSSKLRIGMVSVDAPPYIGGMGRHVGSLMKALENLGVDVRLYDRTKRPLHYRLGKNVGFSLGLASALRSWIAAEGIDLLHVHAGPGGVFLPFPPIPMIVTANHTYQQQRRIRGQWWKWIFLSSEWTTYLSAQSVACISSDTAESIRRDYRVSENRIRTIPCGFDTKPWEEASALSEHRRGCVFVGRNDARKGYDVLLEAWNIIRLSHPDEILLIVGIESKNRDGIRFLGRLSDADLRSLVGRSKVLLMPSRLEGFGLAAAEAIAAGTPVVAMDVAGLRTVVTHGVSGLLTPFDSDSFASATMSVLSDDLLWKRLHDGCAQKRSRFSVSREAEAYRDLYHQVYSSSACATHELRHIS